jgi:hypothetical protein
MEHTSTKDSIPSFLLRSRSKEVGFYSTEFIPPLCYQKQYHQMKAILFLFVQCCL